MTVRRRLSGLLPWVAVGLAAAGAWLACGPAPAAAKAAARAARAGTARSARGQARAHGAAVDSNKVLVRIGGETITRGDVQRRIESLPEQFRANYTTPEGRQQLLDRMIEEKVWMQMAVKNGVAERPQVRQQIEQQRRDLIIRTYLNDVMATNPAASDSETHAYYDAHIADYRVPATVTLRHIQLKKEADAKRVLMLAKSPNAKWDELVKRWSVDSLTRSTGGSLGTVTKEGQFASIGAQPALAESAFKVGPDRVAGPFKTDRGWHVIKVESVKQESTRPFDQVKSIITRQLNSQHTQDYYKQRLEAARKALGVKPDSAAIKGFISQKRTAREMFNEAQTLGAAQARIDAYEALLRDYPDSEVSPQAQFMVGFINSEELKNYDAAEKAFHELLQRWPKAELATSAQWMIEHMRSDEAPAFINLDSDSLSAGSAAAGAGKRDMAKGAATRSGEAAKPAPGGAAKARKGTPGKP